MSESIITKTKKNTKPESRTKVVQVKVSQSEYEQIKKQAEEAGFGSKVSTYARSQALHPCAAATEGKLRQEIATLLCTHSQLVEVTDDPVLRLQYSNWEESVWQSIRPSTNQATTATEMQQNEC